MFEKLKELRFAKELEVTYKCEFCGKTDTITTGYDNEADVWFEEVEENGQFLAYTECPHCHLNNVCIPIENVLSIKKIK